MFEAIIEFLVKKSDTFWHLWYIYV